MNATDRARFGLAMNAMAGTFQKDMSRAALEGYWLGLEDLALAEVERAIAQAIRTCRFMPVPAELRDLAGAGGLSLKDRALRAWEVFRRAMEIHCPDDTVCFDDPPINATVRSLGGWIAADDRLEADRKEFEVWYRKSFLEAYESYCRAGVSERANLPLIGLVQKENQRLGFGDEWTDHVGNRRKLYETKRIKTGLPPLRVPGPASGRPSLVDRTPPRDVLTLTENIGRLP